MNFKNMWIAGQVRVEYRGYLPDEAFEAISRFGGSIQGFAPLVITVQDAAGLAAALTGILDRAGVGVRLISLRRSAQELAAVAVA